MVNNRAKLITEIKDCKYRLPCGWCDRKNELCVYEQQSTEIDIPDTDSISNQLTPLKCSHNWEIVSSISTTGGINYRCTLCGAIKTEPFNYPGNGWITNAKNNDELNSIWKSLDETPDACKSCPNHPANGGSGNCNCILGQPKITCSTAANNIEGEIK